jgi:hypothetical protein
MTHETVFFRVGRLGTRLGILCNRIKVCRKQAVHVCGSCGKEEHNRQAFRAISAFIMINKYLLAESNESYEEFHFRVHNY